MKILFDTETTGLVQPLASNLTDQPEIIEFAAIKVDAGWNEVDRIHLWAKPVKPLPAQITAITRITPDMLADKPRFRAHIPALRSFFLGCDTLVAHNLDFDRNMLEFELERAGMTRAFPWPWLGICTVEATLPIRHSRIKLDHLYEILFERKMPDHHSALADTESLHQICRELVARKMIH